MRQTLGGERLGAGKKIQVDTQTFNRSTFDMGYVWRSTMGSGTLVPFLCEVGLPGDTFDINLNCDIKTHPTIGPLFGSYKIQLDVFYTPIRIYNSLLHNNKIGIGRDMSKALLPIFQLTVPSYDPTINTDIDNSQINPSCILSYLGMRGSAMTATSYTYAHNFNAVSLLNYWDIYKNYYANKSEEKGAVIHTPAPALQAITVIYSLNALGTATAIPKAPSSGQIPITRDHTINIEWTGASGDESNVILHLAGIGPVNVLDLYKEWRTQGPNRIGKFDHDKWGDQIINTWRDRSSGDPYPGKPKATTFNLANIDSMREALLAHQSQSVHFIVNTPALEPYKWLFERSGNDVPNTMSNQEGLALKTYQSDQFNSWLNTEWISGSSGVNTVTRVSTVNDYFTVDSLLIAQKVYNMLNDIAVSGGSYDDYLDAVYDEKRYNRPYSPVYMGGLSKELVFQEVVSNSASEDQPLGTLAGRGVMAGKHKGGNIVIKCDEPSYIMGIISLTPRVDYSQGNKWDTELRTIADLHKPHLDQIGFQDLMGQQLAWWSTNFNSGTTTKQAIGKQPAWLNYMTNVNRTYGNFAIPTNQMFMTLNRRYEHQVSGGIYSIKDATSYIDPSKYNFIFAQTALDAQNFWAQIAVDIIARRKISSKIMPHA